MTPTKILTQKPDDHADQLLDTLPFYIYLVCGRSSRYNMRANI